MPLIETKGAASAQGFGEFAASSGAVTYIEDVFSTYLYTGNGSTQTITNGIDLAGKGGLVWIKNRLAAEPHQLFDTVRGLYKNLNTNNTSQQFDQNPNGVSAFNSNGFSVTGTSPSWNQNNSTQVSWTFRKQPKFFDIVTWTVNNASSRTVSHSLGSTPGFILIKNLTTAEDWVAWHKDAANGWTGALNSATAFTRSTNNCNSVTSTTFDTNKNSSPDQYVAYLFAHNAGGFGLTGTDNVITCGSFTTSAGGYSGILNLGFEPQWILLKATSTSDGWQVADIMRTLTATGRYVYLNPNLADVESGVLTNTAFVNSTGFYMDNILGSTTYAYVAIRRGPMKVPTSGTSVFSAVAYTGDGNVGRTVSTTITPDLSMTKGRSNSYVPFWNTRLQGKGLLYSSSTTEERQPTGFTNGGFSINTNSQAQIVIEGGSGGAVLNSNESGTTYINWNFRRAPGFFDEVCFTGDGTSSRAITHNLGVAPELIIVKTRSVADGWAVYQKDLPSGYYLALNTISQRSNDATKFTTTAPTASTFNVGSGLNQSGRTFVAYLFSSCTGVSKVGSFTGTATTQDVNCGFTSGARFVLLKQAYPSTGDWYVWDSVRGIVAGNDPYLLLNNTDVEVTNTDYVDTYSAGFQLSSTAPYAINGSGCQIIYLAIA